MTQLRDHTFLGLTQSLCPECLALVPAKIITKGSRVYFRKRCPTHGVREDFICSDVSQYDQMQYSLPGKVPPQYGTLPDKGCPFDCGLCTEHEQHTCVGLVELTSSCNLRCPMCYASSGPGGVHLSYDECVRSIDRLVAVEGRGEVLQLSGGEPTIHPEFLRVLEYAALQPIDIVMINTNGIRMAHDRELLDGIERLKHRVEVYFQFDGFDDHGSEVLRGEPLVDTKLKALEALGRRGIKTSLVCTLQPGVNEHEIGAIIRFGLERPWITGVSFQPATYSGRHVLPEDLERRITFPDVIRAIASQTNGVFREDDFMPLPCAHPNCHSLTYAFRSAGKVVPLPRFIDARNHLEILANGILFTRNRARQLIDQYLAKVGGCGSRCASFANANGNGSAAGDSVEKAASEFFARALSEELAQSDVFRITITSFLDAYNFDVRRLMKCCIHHVLPSGHVIPFCAYNVLYREGHVVLPMLRDAGVVRESETIQPQALIELTGEENMIRELPWSYPLIMLASVAVAVLLSRRGQAALGLSQRERLGVALGAFCGAMIGAKLPFVLSDWEGLASGRAWLDNGKTIVFGLVGGYFGVELAKIVLGIRVKTGDSFAVPVAAAVAIGRLACFVAGCCYGTVTALPWGVDFGDGHRRHPTQLYESAFHLGAALALAWLQRRGLLRGQLIKLYIILYLSYRFLTELIRPEPVLALGLTGYQWACLGLVPLFAGLWMRDARSSLQPKTRQTATES